MKPESKSGRPHNPRKGANIFSVLTFAYTFPTFLQGRRKGFTEEDVVETLDDHLSKKLREKLERFWLIEQKSYNKPYLLRALFRAFYIELITLGFILVSMELLRTSQPVAICLLVKYYTESSSRETSNEAYYYAGWLIAAVFLKIVFLQFYMQTMALLGMKMRVACSSLIYKKTLKLSKCTIGGIQVGKLTSLLSNDVGRFDTSLLYIHCLWFCPLQVILIVYLLYEAAGWTSTVGIVLTVFLFPLHVYCGRMSAQRHSSAAAKTDERIKLINEIISGIQVIKMYTWEKPFSYLVDTIRRLELQEIGAISKIEAFLFSTSFIPKIAIFLSLMTYILTGNIPTAEYMFSVASFYNILRDVIGLQFVRGMGVLDALVSLKRIEQFLASDEVQQRNSNYIHALQPGRQPVILNKVSASWSSVDAKPALRNINIAATAGQLSVLIGPVGSGKTTILNTILNEIQITEGHVYVSGKISYAAQDPWIFSGNIQQNILAWEDMNLQRYKDVIRVCCLERDLEMLAYGDQTIVGERGATLSGGQRTRISLARAVYSDSDIYLLDDPLSAVDPHVANKLFRDCITSFLREKCVLLVTNQLQYLHEADQIYLIEQGNIVVTGTFQTILESGLDFVSDLNRKNVENELSVDSLKRTKLLIEGMEVKESPNESIERRDNGTISPRVYMQYFNSCKSFCSVLFIAFCFIATQTLVSVGDYFMLYWATLEKEDDFGALSSRTTCMYIYSAIVALFTFLALLRSFMFFQHCLKSAAKLHKDMSTAVISCPLKFFNTNSSGRILNRFSKDIAVVDENIPKSAMCSFQIGLIVLGAMVIIAVINPWILIVNAMVIIAIYYLRRMCLPATTSIKRLEGTARSPIFSQANSTVQGLTTVRAFNMQGTLIKKFDDLLDLHSSIYSLHVACTRAFCNYVEITCIVYLAIVIISTQLMANDDFGGKVGLVVTQATSISGFLQWFIRECTDLDSYMLSAERVLEYSNLDQEYVKHSKEPSPGWPTKGEIKFMSVSLKYGPTNPYALDNVNFHIQDKEKVGIVGRTGAGKSSLTWALFQLTCTEGVILINGLDISKMPLSNLRSKISIIPQQPVLFSGCLRKNLDPFNRYPDEALWNALNDVELKALVAELPLGLNQPILEGGVNFSVGQRQLVCLARAILSENKILILDEATASIDPKSDLLIQNTIKRKFKECTVLTIAHRLNTIIDCDKVMVIDSGNVVQFDHPYVLMNNKNGLFYSMVQQMGEEFSEMLTTAATNTMKFMEACIF